MEFYKPSDEPQRLVLSNMQYGLLKEFYKGGMRYTVKKDEALLLDQRSFGPAVARGLLAFDGHVWYMTEEGRDFMKSYESRTPWKDDPSREFSHYIKAMKMILGGNGNGKAKTRRRSTAA